MPHDDLDCPPECCPPDDYWPGYHEDPPEMTLLQWLDNQAIIGRILRRRPDEEEIETDPPGTVDEVPDTTREDHDR